jgi:ribosomal protein L40E
MKSPIAVRKKDEKSASGKNITVTNAAPSAFPAPPPIAPAADTQETIDLERRRAQLSAKVAELQWDLGGLTYEMASRNRMRIDVLVKRAAELQEVDAELGEIERILRMERTGVAALCLTCGAPHSSGAVYCWQCGTSLLEKIPGATIAARNLG